MDEDRGRANLLTVFCELSALYTEVHIFDMHVFFFLILSIDMRISFHEGSILEKNSPLGAMSTWNTKTLEKRTNFIHMKQ